jgi:nucleoid DNA-binding protein
MNRKNHKELISEVAEKISRDNLEVKEVINTYLEAIEDTLVSGKAAVIKGIGVIKINELASKRAYDFKQKKNVVRPRRNLPKMSFNRSFIKNIKKNTEG